MPREEFRCGLHESCADCHHENSNDPDEMRTCIQQMHDEYHEMEAILNCEDGLTVSVVPRVDDLSILPSIIDTFILQDYTKKVCDE